ncbi:MAG: LysR family transcriptional regulator [Coriobacteriales bacterium]|jgi:LysR family transcriptional activator of glutamate synthase operon|nr:LysR family transcriptional regulator [Coriobacteriales bacterium]
MVDFQQLNHFLAAASHLNLTQASAELYITQSALSKQIATMEAELNLQLFIRGKRGLILTPAGQVLQEELPACINLYQSIVKKAQDAYRGYRGHLTIAILDGLPFQNLLAEIVPVFKKEYSNIEVSFVRRGYSRIRDGLVDKSIDAAVIFQSDTPPPPEFTSLLLGSSELTLFYSASHPLADSTDVSLADMRNAVFLIPEGFDSGIQIIVEQAKTLDFSPQIKEVDCFVTMALEVEAGAGVGLISKDSSLLNSPHTINARLLSDTTQELALVYTDSNRNQCLRDFIGTIRAGMAAASTDQQALRS